MVLGPIPSSAVHVEHWGSPGEQLGEQEGQAVRDPGVLINHLDLVPGAGAISTVALGRGIFQVKRPLLSCGNVLGPERW